MKSHVTNFGIAGIGVVPYGVHLCHFYPSRQELIDGLVPYFEAGLANNERCIWVASSPLPAGEIAHEISKSAELERGLITKQLSVFDAAEWYGDPASLNGVEVVGKWINEEERALAGGFEGLRINWNTSFVPPFHWRLLMEYEKALHEQVKERRIVTCCSYHRGNCKPVETLDVVHLHDGALDRSENRWQLFLHPPGTSDVNW